MNERPYLRERRQARKIFSEMDNPAELQELLGPAGDPDLSVARPVAVATMLIIGAVAAALYLVVLNGQDWVHSLLH